MSQEQSSTTRDLGGGPLRILQINSSISRRSGVMSVLMNYLRHMDRSQVVFDFFCYATPDETHREEIEALGGRCYVIDAGNHIGRIRSSLGSCRCATGYCPACCSSSCPRDERMRPMRFPASMT